MPFLRSPVLGEGAITDSRCPTDDGCALVLTWRVPVPGSDADFGRLLLVDLVYPVLPNRSKMWCHLPCGGFCRWTSWRPIAACFKCDLVHPILLFLVWLPLHVLILVRADFSSCWCCSSCSHLPAGYVSGRFGVDFWRCLADPNLISSDLDIDSSHFLGTFMFGVDQCGLVPDYLNAWMVVVWKFYRNCLAGALIRRPSGISVI